MKNKEKSKVNSEEMQNPAVVDKTDDVETTKQQDLFRQVTAEANDKSAENQASEDTKATSSNHISEDTLGVLAAFILGAVLALLIVGIVYAYQIKDANSAKDCLIGTWTLPAEDGSDSPKNFAFYKDYVDVEVEEGRLIRCKYEASVTEDGEKLVTIYDVGDKDMLVMTFTEQRLIHFEGGIKASYYSPNETKTHQQSLNSKSPYDLP